MSQNFTISARPEPLTIDSGQTAVIVVDMQNAFASKGGYLDLYGVDIAGAPGVIRQINRVLAASRPAGMPVVFLQMGWERDLCDAGGPTSPNWHKARSLRFMRQRPELQGQLMIRGTWDYSLVDDLKPEPHDLVVHKPRYSGFYGTNLDMLLRARGIRNLVFTGIATNVCVESTLRDAFFLEYFPVLVTDCTMPSGPPSLQEATLFNVQQFFGWTTSTDEFVGAIQALPA
jgi:ureidoacrylate peracid hydrolase